MKLGLSMIGPDMPPEPGDISAMEADIAEMNRMVDGFLDYARDDAQDSAPQPIAAAGFLEGLVADAQRAGQQAYLQDASQTNREGSVEPGGTKPQGNA